MFYTPANGVIAEDYRRFMAINASVCIAISTQHLPLVWDHPDCKWLPSVTCKLGCDWIKTKSKSKLSKFGREHPAYVTVQRDSHGLSSSEWRVTRWTIRSRVDGQGKVTLDRPSHPCPPPVGRSLGPAPRQEKVRYIRVGRPVPHTVSFPVPRALRTPWSLRWVPSPGSCVSASSGASSAHTSCKGRFLREDSWSLHFITRCLSVVNSLATQTAI